MPIYEYQCKKCGWHFEKRQSVADGPLTKCEKCGGEVQKQWSLSGFQFKGEGWYVTDYAAKKAGGGEKTSGKEKAAESGSESKEKSSPAESTAATDTASKPKSDTASQPKKDTSSTKT